MKTKPQTKDFDSVKFMRQERDRIAKELSKMSPEEVVEYFKKNQPKERVKPSA